MNKGLRRVAAVAVAALVVAPALATAASATPTFAFDRLAGSDRNATAVAVAAEYGNSTNVILANGTKGHTVDALTAAYLAGVKKAPVLLTALKATPDNVLARITASGATDIWLVGDEGVISASQAAALDAKFGTVHRLGGLDRFLTAQAIIAEASKTAASKTAIVTTGFNFPDALGAGPLSYVKNMPIGITSRGTLPAATLTALKDAKVTSAIVLGGPTVVPPAIVAELTANGITPFVGAGVEAGRLYGADRSSTSAKIAEYELLNGFTNTGVNVASGQASLDGADALGGAPLSGKETRPTLITESVTTVGPNLLAYLTARCATLAKGHIFGDKGAVSATSEAAMQAAGRCTASNQAYTVTPNTATSVAVNKTITYTASGFAAGDLLRIALVDPALITGGVYTLDTGNRTANLAVASNVKITQINGVTVTPGAPTIFDFTAIGSSLTFTVATVDGVTASDATPVVFKRSDAADTTLNVNLAGAPTEASGIGGDVNFVTAVTPVAAENADHSFTTEAVKTINGTTSFTMNLASPNNGSLVTLATDTYLYGATPSNKANFYAALSVGDLVTVNYVNGGPNTFTLATDNFASDANANSALTSVTADGSLVTITYTNPVGTSVGGTTYTLQRAPIVSGLVGAYTTVKTGLVADYAVTTVTDTPADGTYVYRLKYTAPAFSSAVATGTPATGDNVGLAPYISANGFRVVTVPTVASVAAPLVLRTYTTVNTSAVNNLSQGDVFKVVFDRAIVAPIAGAKVTITTAGDLTFTAATSTAAGSATFSVNTAAEVLDGASIGAGRVLTVTLLADPITAKTFPATITGFTGIANATGTATVPAGTGVITSS